MHTLANSEYPDEMLQIAAFHQCLHYLLRQNELLNKNTIFILKLNPVAPEYSNEPSEVNCIKLVGKVH